MTPLEFTNKVTEIALNLETVVAKLRSLPTENVRSLEADAFGDIEALTETLTSSAEALESDCYNESEEDIDDDNFDDDCEPARTW